MDKQLERNCTWASHTHTRTPHTYTRTPHTPPSHATHAPIARRTRTRRTPHTRAKTRNAAHAWPHRTTTHLLELASDGLGVLLVGQVEMEHQVGLALAHRVAQVDHHEHDRTQRLDRHRVRAAQRGDHLDLAPHALEHERPLVLEHHDRLERRREHVVVHHLDHRHQRLRQRADGAARDDGVEHVVDPEPEERARAAAVHAHLLVQGRERAAALLHGRALGAIGQRHV
eukprot:7071492-Prymnesium_polylepis.2